jgi:hypothetical protein
MSPTIDSWGWLYLGLRGLIAVSALLKLDDEWPPRGANDKQRRGSSANDNQRQEGSDA